MIRILALLLPYLAISIGLFQFFSGWWAIGIYHSGMLCFLILDQNNRPPLRLLLSGWNKTWAGLILFSALGGLLIYYLWPFIQQYDLNFLLMKYGLTGKKWLIFLFYYSIFNPLIEQFYWRGYLGHSASSVRIEDFAFAGYHFFTMICFVDWHWALLTFVILTGMAWVWRQITRDTGGLLIPILSHLAADISIIWVVNALR